MTTRRENTAVKITTKFFNAGICWDYDRNYHMRVVIFNNVYHAQTSLKIITRVVRGTADK